MVIDTIHTYLQLVPMSLSMPYVQVSTGLHIDFSGVTPPYFSSWPHETTPEALARNLEGIKEAGRVLPNCATRDVLRRESGSGDCDSLKEYWTLDFGRTAERNNRD